MFGLEFVPPTYGGGGFVEISVGLNAAQFAWSGYNKRLRRAIARHTSYRSDIALDMTAYLQSNAVNRLTKFLFSVYGFWAFLAQGFHQIMFWLLRWIAAFNVLLGLLLLYFGIEWKYCWILFGPSLILPIFDYCGQLIVAFFAWWFAYGNLPDDFRENSQALGVIDTLRDLTRGLDENQQS
tara:strand:+ start:5214 stop:5756 length:543 start_codon:yes stop_codon:yes gene_type:complete